MTLPRLAPAILAGGLLAFTFSFDDFITSFFVSGAGTTTLPLRIFSSLRFGVSPAINATAAMILALTLRRRRRRLPRPPADLAKPRHLRPPRLKGAPVAVTVRTLQNFIGGEWVEATGETARKSSRP